MLVCERTRVKKSIGALKINLINRPRLEKIWKYHEDIPKSLSGGSLKEWQVVEDHMNHMSYAKSIVECDQRCGQEEMVPRSRCHEKMKKKVSQGETRNMRSLRVLDRFKY